MKRPIDPSRIEVLDQAIVEILKRKTPSERLAMVFAANRTMRLRLEGHFRTYHPDWTDAQIQQEIAKRMLGGTAGATAPCYKSADKRSTGRTSSIGRNCLDWATLGRRSSND